MPLQAHAGAAGDVFPGPAGGGEEKVTGRTLAQQPPLHGQPIYDSAYLNVGPGVPVPVLYACKSLRKMSSYVSIICAKSGFMLLDAELSSPFYLRRTLEAM